MIGGGYFQFLEISVFFIHRKLRPMNEKPSGRDAHLAEKKLAVNSTARVRKSRKRLFIFYCNKMGTSVDYIYDRKNGYPK